MNSETRLQRVVLETTRHRIVGDVSIPAEGHRTRFSDLLNREGVRFVPLVNVRISGLNGEDPEERPFVAVAHEHIQLAYEDPDA
jgi:hypothetical protein